MLDLARLLAAVDLGTFIQRSGSQLRPSGKQWRGRCPLHGGSNGSAFVIYEGSDGRQRWHCHADCDTGGDAIDFVRHWHGLPDSPEGFWAAATELATSIGQPLERFVDENGSAPTVAPSRSSDVLTLAAQHYQTLLQSRAGKAARHYARSRGWQDNTIHHFLGYSRGQLRRALQTQQVDLKAAVEAGLLRERADGQLVDAIPTGYLVYLHRTPGGRICYLSGRALHSDEPARKARNLAAPKRLFFTPHTSSADSPLVIVEGQADALSVHEWGRRAVALCGSSLRAQDVSTLRRSSTLFLALDADAGRRLSTLASQLGPLTRIVPPPDTVKDLNAWHQAGASAAEFDALLDQAEPWIEQQLREVAAPPLWQRADGLEALALSVSELPLLLQESYLQRICDDYRLAGRHAFQQAVAAYAAPTMPQVARHANGIVVDGRQISNFACEIINEAIDESGERRLTLRGHLTGGEPLPECALSLGHFLNDPWWLQAWGHRALCTLAPHEQWLLAHAIQVLST
ncbi:MAG: toprim domain-containing protein [Anaerolineales bacterium]|nr:toprim domain-containing protein [Anaerolineales bacterium]